MALFSTADINTAQSIKETLMNILIDFAELVVELLQGLLACFKTPKNTVHVMGRFCGKMGQSEHHHNCENSFMKTNYNKLK